MARSSSSLTRAGSLVGPAMAAANLLQYALQLVASRALSTNGFGAFGALLGLGVVGAVPMLALQTVTARHVALGRPAETARLVTVGLRAGVALSLLLPLAAPLVAAFLHVPVLAAVFLGLSLGPLAVAGTAQGVLQGREQFGALALLFIGVSALRVVVPAVTLLVSPSVTWGLAGAAVGSLLAGALAMTVVRNVTVVHQLPEAPATHGRTDLLPELRQAVSGILALLVLGGADLLLARHVLPGSTSGRYAAGSLIARGCFWAPQFVAVLVVPRVASGQAVLGRAVGLVVALGAVAVLVASLVPRSVVALAFGPSYGSLAHVLGLFALAGAALAVLQLLLCAGIARGGSVVGRIVWSAIAVEALVVLTLRPSLVGLVLTAVASTITAACAALAFVNRQPAVAVAPLLPAAGLASSEP